MASHELHGKVVVITGASSGFGKAAARRFAKDGSSVVLAARRKDLLEQLAQECRASGAGALSIEADVSDPAAVERLYRAAVAEFGRIDVWVNNAGVGAIGRFEDIPLEDQAQVIATNLLGTLYGSYYAYGHFVRQGSGILINIASELGEESVPYYAAYTASKHGVIGLCDALRQEAKQAEQNIHICAIMPTAHDTPFFDHVANYSGHEVEPPSPLHDPENVAEAIVAAARDPANEDIVGWDGVIKIVMKRLAPRTTDAVTAKFMHKTQMDKPPPAPTSPGAVRRPMKRGTEVSAGRRHSG